MQARGNGENVGIIIPPFPLSVQRLRVFILSKFSLQRQFQNQTNQTQPCRSWRAATVQLDSKFNFSRVMLFTLSPHINL